MERSKSQPPSLSARRHRATQTERPDRKQAILLAAEKLFAQRGFHAVTIRDIAVEAGVPLALVGYYYGQKDELFYAIFEHWNQAIEARLTRLRGIDTTTPGIETLTKIIEAFTAPVITLRASAEGEYYALLVARELFHARPEVDRIMRDFFDPMARAFADALHCAMPGATRGQVAWVYQFSLGSLLHHLTDMRVDWISNGESRANDPAAAPMLVSYIVGGIVASIPEAFSITLTPKKDASTRRTRRQK